MGESGSGKTHTLAGEGTSKAGLVPTILDAVFARLHAGLYPFFTSGPFCSILWTGPVPILGVSGIN